MTRHPVLRPGDTLRLGGETRTVAGLDGATVRLADVTGVVTEMPTAGLLADPSLELVTGSRVPIAPQPALERLPAETVDNARWWERHLIEVITGVPPGSPPGTRPRPEYDPARRSLRQRELAKHDELTLAGHRVGLSTVKRRAAACSPAVTRSATGTAQLAEIARQLRGRAGPRQVRRHRVGLVETMGGGAAGMDGNASVVTILSAQD
jgi:hypothetical protein